MIKRTSLSLLFALSAATTAGATTYPQPIPSGFSPTSGPPGTVITVTGSGFTGLNAAWIGVAHDAAVNVVSDSEVKITVPSDATTANLGLLNPQHSDFTATAFTVTKGGSGGTTVSGAVSGSTTTAVQLSGATTQHTSVNSSGSYSFSQVANGTYTLTPAAATHVFTPASVATQVAGAPVSNVNFSAASTSSTTYRISGTIAGDVASNVVVTLNGTNVGSASTDLGGAYTFSGLKPGTYTLAASLSGQSFSQSKTVTLSNVDSTENNFSSASATGNITLSAVSPMPNATVGQSYSQSLLKSISGGSGSYHYQSGSYATGTPPIGMAVNNNGTLTGTPTTAGKYTFQVCATDSAGHVTQTCSTTSITVGSSSGPPPPPGTSWVYYNGVFDWPGDYSFVATPNYSDTSGGPLSGPHDIKITLTGAWGGWLPYAQNWDFNSSGYTKLTFALKPTVANQKWQVYFVKVGDVPVGIYLDVSKYGPTPVAGQWATYTVPLSDLGVLGTSIYKFCIQDETGLSSNSWYVDNVGFEP